MYCCGRPVGDGRRVDPTQFGTHPSREQLVLACECGSTLKASSLDPAELDGLAGGWRGAHVGHEQVECWEAARIRAAERSRGRVRLATRNGTAVNSRHGQS